MDKKLVLSVAGSGKTYSIAKNIDVNKRNVIFTFNNRNVENLKKELIKRYGNIPENTIVLTFHKFRYDYILKPTQYDYFPCDRTINGIDIINVPPVPTFLVNGYRVANQKYKKDCEIDHYFYDDKVYSSYMSKLIIKRGLVGKSHLEKFVDCIYIDEFQDFEDYDFKVLKELYKLNIGFRAYGDYYQAGVSMNCQMKKIPYNKVENFEEYKDKILSELRGIHLDLITLKKSRRVGSQITNYINDIFDEEMIESLEMNDTQLSILGIEEIDNIRDDIEIYLVWDKKTAKKYSLEKYITWSLSKGDTYDRACLVLTKDTTKFLNKETTSLKKTTVNKLYVALTRSKEKLYILLV